MATASAALPLVGFVVYVAVSMLMINDPSRPLLPPPLGGKVQLSEVIFPLAIAPWVYARLPGIRRAALATGAPLAIWVTANAVTSVAAVLPGLAWRETAAFAYLGVVLIWGVALLTEPARLRSCAWWWSAVVAGVVVVGLAGWLAATVSGVENPLVYRARRMPLFGDWVFRVESTLEPTSKLLSTLLILALPAAFALRRHGGPRERRLSGWLIGAMTVCELLTFSRQILEFVGVLALLIILGMPRRRPLLLAGLGIAYLAGFLAIQGLSTWRVTEVQVTHAADRSRFVADRFYYTTLPDIGVQTVALRAEYVHDNYFVLKRTAWHGFLERPLTGWGPDTWSRVLQWAKETGRVPPSFPRFGSAQSEPFTIATEMGLVGLAAWTAFWVLCFRPMWAPTGRGFAGMLARYQCIGCGAVLLTSIHLDVMRFRFLWVSLALGMAAAICAREGPPA